MEAARLLERLRDRAIDTPAQATPVDALAETLGLDVAPFHPATRRKGTLGWLEPGENLIFLSDGLTEPVRRFTLAHEIGHFVLHREPGDGQSPFETADAGWDQACDGVDLAGPLDALTALAETLQPGQAYSGRARRESEANAFAASLLLPTDALLAHYRRVTLTHTPKTKRIRLLAERFRVTEDVLLRRLTALLLPGADELDTAALEPTLAGRGEHLTRTATLDLWQQRAARSETPALVVAGPGTGKTSTLIGRVAYLLTEAKAPARSILALTFSNKAAREMRERLRVLLAPKGDAPRTGLSTVSTIHAFCGDLLRRYAPLVGLRPDFRLVTETDGYFILRRLAGELSLRRYSPLAAPAQHFPAILGAISRAKDELCGPEQYMQIARELRERAQSADALDEADRTTEIAEVYAAYQAALAERGDADFGDLVRLAVQLLQKHPDVLAEVRTAYQHILVDEFQDINRAMGVLLRTLAGADGPLWAVGDADQAIYRFRGASPANLARFEHEYPAARVHLLKRNYRSVPEILEAAAAVASQFLPGGERPALETERPAGPDAAVTLATAPDEASELAGLAQAIRARCPAGRALAEQVVLCRTRRHVQKVADALRAADIPVHLVTPLLEQDEIKDVLAVLALLADPSGAGLLRAGNLADHAFSKAEASKLLAEARARALPLSALLGGALDDIAELSESGRRGLKALLSVLGELRRAPDAATGLARYVFGHSNLGRHLLAGAFGDAGERSRAAAMAQLLSLARTFEDRQHTQAVRRSDKADWAGFLDYVRVVSALRQESGSAADDLAAGDVDRIRVLTVHASKGLEFPVVYLPGLADRRFPSQRRSSVVSSPDGMLEEGAVGEDQHRAEEACLFYVALTRARDELVLSVAEQYGKLRYRPSPFLAPLAERLGVSLAYERWVERLPGARIPADAEVPIEDAVAELDGRPVHVAELETYRRCPRQYAYRYVYRLRPSEIGLTTLRRTLHDTLHLLQSRFEDVSAVSAAPSLGEALELFEWQWTEALARGRPDEAVPPAQDEPAADGTAAAEPFIALYRRHGRQVVERMWERLSHEPATGTPRPADQATQVALGARYDQTVTVRAAGHEIAVTLDRVEGSADGRTAAAGTAAGTGEIQTSAPRIGTTASTASPAPFPTRLVRHRLGHGGSTQADLRQLLYTLAAEQGLAAPAELYTHNLTTGEMERVELDRRKLIRLHEELDQTLDGIRRRIYAPRPDPNTCQSCPFLLICPA
jgi:superfamily I DNA/RNA helicase/Zn-dependent peptidase ImmA (M78 family)